MDNKILVAYASTHGSTREVAEVIAEELQNCGLMVNLQLARNVRTLEGYRAVVLGGPLYMFHWHKDTHRFLARFEKVITGGLPVAIFASGPMGPAKEGDWQEIRTKFEQELARYSWLTPTAIEIIGGKFDPDALRFPYKLIPALRQMPASDLRDWAAIRTWAVSLVDQFYRVVA